MNINKLPILISVSLFAACSQGQKLIPEDKEDAFVPSEAGSSDNDGGLEAGDINDSSSSFIIDAQEEEAAPPKPTCGDYPNYPDVSKCKLDETCLKHSDCLSDACNYKGKCIAEKSCAGHFGGDSCGAGEDAKENCCASLPIPSGVSLGVYKITAGRMRQMVERTNGNIKEWYLNNRSTLRADAVAQLDPFANQLPSSNKAGEPYSVPEQLGVYPYVPDKPSSRQGCNNNPGANGGHTYWFSKEDNEYYGNTEQGFSKDELDMKPINCTTLPMMMVLCAFDGGRLQTRAENDLAWGNERYPWGAGPEAGGFGHINGGYDKVGPAWKAMGALAGACPNCDVTITNWSYTYQFPVGGNPDMPSDYNYYISPPGRFPRDKGPFNHFDLGALMIEATGTPAQYIDDHGRSTYVYGRQGSFEGHPVSYTKYAFNAWVRYQKFSGRCAY